MKGLDDLLKQAQKMQAQMAKIQEDLEGEQVGGSAGGRAGMVAALDVGTFDKLGGARLAGLGWDRGDGALHGEPRGE